MCSLELQGLDAFPWLKARQATRASIDELCLTGDLEANIMG